MNRNQYSFCVAEACCAADRDAYVSDLALSSIWGDAEEDSAPKSRIDDLGKIWDACNTTIGDVAKDAGISLRSLAIQLCIPYRTVQDWSSGARKCPIYVHLMIQQSLGLYSPPVD